MWEIDGDLSETCNGGVCGVLLPQSSISFSHSNENEISSILELSFITWIKNCFYFPWLSYLFVVLRAERIKGRGPKFLLIIFLPFNFIDDLTKWCKMGQKWNLPISRFLTAHLCTKIISAWWWGWVGVGLDLVRGWFGVFSLNFRNYLNISGVYLLLIIFVHNMCDLSHSKD